MSENNRSNLTIYEVIAIQVLVLYRNKTGKGDMDLDTIWSDEKLTECILEATAWYENTDSAEINEASYYPYIKKVNEKYLNVIKSKAFLSTYTDELRKCLMDVYKV